VQYQVTIILPPPKTSAGSGPEQKKCLCK